MGMKTILTTLEKNSVSGPIDLQMGEEQTGPLTIVTFQVEYGTANRLYDPISTPYNNAYQITGEERIPYQKIWEELSKSLNPDPLEYLGRDPTKYKKNIPNMLHLVKGWLEKYKLFQEGLKARKININIRMIGKTPFDPEQIAALEEIVSQWDLYTGYRIGDAPIRD